MTTRTFIAATSLALSLGLVACASKPMMAMHHGVSAKLSASNEVPPVTSSATGSFEATLNPHTGMLTWTLTFANLTGPANGAHLHGPAVAGQNAGVVIAFTDNLSSPMKGSVTLTEAQQADVRAGRWYVNVHTVAHPGGEIRGQLVAMHP